MPTPRRGRLSFTPLEDRTAPAVFTVTTTQDNGDNTNPTAGSLRAAIVAANAASGSDAINFAIAGGGGVQTISPTTGLPAVTDTVTIDGTTQSGYGGSPLVRISGANAGAGADGLLLLYHTGSVVKGLAVGGFAGGAGVRISGGGQHQLQNDYIGTAATGTSADPNAVGVVVTGGSTQNVIGGSQATRNVISGNTGAGVLVTAAAVQTTVAADYIGVGGDGVTRLANGGDGVQINGGSTFTTVGGSTTGSGNTIASNGGAGVHVSDAGSAGTIVQGNRIGLDVSGGASGNGGDGVRADAAAGTGNPRTSTQVRGNTIQRNAGAGVAVLDTTRYVRVGDNSINQNGGLGLNVAATANAGLAAPVVTKITTDSVNAITVTGTVTGRPNADYVVTIYTDSTADPSGFGEGETVAKAVTVTTDANGAATFTGTVSAAQSAPFVSLTATDSTLGDTSAFSQTLSRPAEGLDGRLGFVAAGSGAPQVALINQSGQTVLTLNAFDAGMTAGVRVAAGDFNGDGIPDVIAGTGPGVVTRVKVIDPTTQAVLFDVQPFESGFTGGVYVSAGDLDGDGKPDLIISPDQGGGPRVDVYSGNGFAKLASFFGIDDPNFRGGARTAVGDINKDGRVDLVVAAGFGGGPRVAAFDGTTVTTGTPKKLFNDFFAFEQTLRNGVFVAAGDINDDGYAELIFGGGPGGGPRVLALDGKALLGNTQTVQANFFAGADTDRGGVRVAARDLNADGSAEVLAGDGPGSGTNELRIYTGSDLTPTASTPTPRVDIEAFPASTDGVYVG